MASLPKPLIPFFTQQTLNKNKKQKLFNSSTFSLNQAIINLFTLSEKDLEQLTRENLFIIASEDKETLEILNSIKKFNSKVPIHEFYINELSPYENKISDQLEIYDFFKNLKNIYEKPYGFLITDIYSLNKRVIDQDFFSQNLNLKKNTQISRDNLIKSLINLGYIESNSIEQAFSFIPKGEIFDISTSTTGLIRLQFFDDLLEHIYPIDPYTFKSQKNFELDEVKIYQSPLIFSFENNLNKIRNLLPKANTKHKLHYKNRQEVLLELSQNILCDNFLDIINFCFNKNNNILSYFENINTYLLINDYDKNIENFNEKISKADTYFKEYNNNLNFDYLLPSIENLFNAPDFQNILDFKNYSQLLSFKDFYNFYLYPKVTNQPFSINLKTLNYLVSFKSNNPDVLSKIIIGYTSKIQLDKLINFLNLNSININQFEFIGVSSFNSFYIPSSKEIFISINEFVLPKKDITKNQGSASQDLFADYLSSLKEGDYIVHKNYGVGLYQGVKKINSINSNTELIELIFSDNDKIYIPIYKIDLIQKYADHDSKTSLSSIKKNNFKDKKNKAKKSIKKLAFNLIEIQAKRKALKGYQFSEPAEDYYRFENDFPFTETPDQMKAIQDVIHDMTDLKPMDRLICGDVGFGKTEIAMRAAMKCVEDHKQVAIIVPTTILSLQHFISFKKRFANQAVQIEYVSRFRSKKELDEIFKKVENNQVDILIGTHKLFSKKIKMNHLGLVIVDEEHRFGVNHKEHFRNQNSKVDFLSLSATPIPRTLQLSFLGIKDISLLKTPPLDRKNISTFFLKEDSQLLKESIEFELKRNGQVFYVHDKVKNIEGEAHKIRELVPSAKIIICHGQLPEKELEKRMNAFFNGDYNVLISTTIIESGIDIPTANTLIVHNADRFGLSQLHQLRGRIGRSNKKAFAYFLVPKNKVISDISEKRLNAIQKFSVIGSGFNIANTDLDIRGAGDILGAEQSGHMRSIGIELYMELLEEEIANLNNTRKTASLKHEFEFNTHLKCLIPDQYIKSQTRRLKTYKKLSSIWENQLLEDYKNELQDEFGTIPKELFNLFNIIKSRNICIKLNINSLITQKNRINLKFDQNTLLKNPKLIDKLVSLISLNPELYQLKANYSFFIKKLHEIDSDELVLLLESLSKQLAISN